MDSPSQEKGLKQVQLCFKTMNAKQCVQATAISKRKRKSADLIIGHNEAKSLKISENFGTDKCLQINIERCDGQLNNNEVELKGNSISGTSKSTSSTSNNGIASDSLAEVIVCETGDKCADEKRVNSPTSTDNMDSSLTEKNCDISLVSNDDASDNSIIILSSSGEEESPPNQGFSVFISSSTNTNSAIGVSSLKHAVLGEHVECSEKTDVLSEKRGSIKDNLLSEQTNPVGQKLPRKRKKMSSSEAQLKAEEREKKIKEKEIQRMQKKKELQAKKVQRTLLKEKKQQEKEKLKLEKQRKKEEEEKERERLKQEKKEQEEREKQKKLLEKEEKNRLKQRLIEEEKKKKEQKLKIIGEKKKVGMQEEKNIQKTKAAFANYFLKSKSLQSPQVSNNVTGDQGMFRPFQVKENMQLAPIVPLAARERFNKINLDQSLKTQENIVLYLDALRSGKHLAFKHKKAKHKKVDSSNEDVVVLLDSKDEGGERMVILDLKEGEDGKQIADKSLKAKLLQFSENIRPPYWGTWRKKSRNIGPRNPLGLDKMFDYDVDSDDEWDEGGPGESLSGTEDEESEDDYEVDNEFFVPHGYLSADEEKDDDLVTSNSELHKIRLKIKEREFQSERSKKTTILRPCLIGCFWQADNMVVASCLLKALNPFSASIITSQPIATNYSLLQIGDSALTQLGVYRTSPVNESNTPKPASYIAVKRPVPEEGIPYLIRLLHANTHNRQTVIKEFQEFWSLHCYKKRVEMVSGDSAEPPLISALSPACNEKLVSDKDEALVGKPQYEKISKRQMDLTIQKLCVWCRCPDDSMNKFCWWVHGEVREKYGLSDLPVPNKWDYVTKKDTENTKPVSQATTPSIKAFLHP